MFQGKAFCRGKSWARLASDHSKVQGGLGSGWILEPDGIWWNLMEFDRTWWNLMQKKEMKGSVRVSSPEWELGQTLSYLKCQTGTRKVPAELKHQGKFKKCFSTLSICSDELLARSFYTCTILLLSDVKLELNVAAGNKINCLICLCLFETRWCWKKRQDLLVGSASTVLPATGWQCSTEKN